MLTPQSSLSRLKGIGKKRALALRQKGLRTVEDLLLYLPRKYERRGRIVLLSQAEGESEVYVKVTSRRWWKKGNILVFQANIEDSSGQARALWFNQKRLLKVIFPGKKYYLKGKAEKKDGRLTLLSPQVSIDVSEGIIPIYEKIYGISSGVIRRLIREALTQTEIKENLPEEILVKYSFPSRKESFHFLHFPPENASLDDLNEGETVYHRRLIYEEAFFYQLSVNYLREKSKKNKGRKYDIKWSDVEDILSLFPFKFMSCQQEALEDIVSDLNSSFPMRRLLHGEVGSGKTAVSIASALLVARKGYQVAFMAPTEILAWQHFLRHRSLIEKAGIKATIFTSGMGSREKKKALEEIFSGKARLIFGTHALFYQGVKFSSLAYAVVDEQHRFGVAQRGRLYQKGENPDVLLLSATPIPRTLALILYSDLSISMLRELPKSRNVETKLLRIRDFKKIVPLLKELMSQGHQGFAVFPVIEQGKMEVIDAERGLKRLRQYFPEFRLDIVHGRMKMEERRKRMEAFEKGNIDLLVSTTVIEVGIDIERASFMLVFNAERFGLAQLHQLRGRIGRGSQKGYFFLLSPVVSERLRFLTKSQNGFEISEYDMKLRGPGNIAGKEQWGLPRFKLLHPFLHEDVLVKAKRDAQRYFSFHKDEVFNIIEENITIG